MSASPKKQGRERKEEQSKQSGKPLFMNLPKHEMEALARCILPDILAYFESEEGQRAFAEWEAQQGQ